MVTTIISHFLCFILGAVALMILRVVVYRLNRIADDAWLKKQYENLNKEAE